MSSLTTKKAIYYALKELLKEQPFNKITINDIAKQCNINRQTFYYHFIDKEDLVEWICKEEMGSILNAKNINKTWEEKFLSVFTLMLSEKSFITNIYHSVSLEILRDNLYRLVYPIIYAEIDKISQKENIEEQEKNLLPIFISMLSLLLSLTGLKMICRKTQKWLWIK